MLNWLNTQLEDLLFLYYSLKTSWRHKRGRLDIFKDIPYWYVKMLVGFLGSADDFAIGLTDELRGELEMARAELALRDARLKKEKENAR